MSNNKCDVDEYDMPYVMLRGQKLFAPHGVLSSLSLVQGQQITDQTAMKIIQENIKECSACPAE